MVARNLGGGGDSYSLCGVDFGAMVAHKQLIAYPSRKRMKMYGAIWWKIWEWYRSHGFLCCVLNRVIYEEWHHNERELLALLEAHS